MKKTEITVSHLFLEGILLLLLFLSVFPKIISYPTNAQELSPQQQFQQPQQQFQQPQQQFQQQQQQSPYLIANVPVGLSPFGIVYNSENGLVYIANFYSNSISVLDGFTNDLIMTIPLDNNTFPAGVATGPENGYVY